MMSEGEGRRLILATLGVTLLLVTGLLAWAGLRPSASEVAYRTLVVEQGGQSRTVEVEVAADRAAWEQGLSMRRGIAPDGGMLFVFPGEQGAGDGFWMAKTWIPLDIAYLDETGRVVKLLTMTPCLEAPPSCPTYPPGHAYHSALEVRAGWFEEHGFTEGARVR